MTSLALRHVAKLKWAGGQVIHLTFYVNIDMLMYWDKSVIDQDLSWFTCGSIYANPVTWVARLLRIRCIRSLDRCLIAKESKH